MSQYLLIFLIFLLSPLPSSCDLGLSCRQHPAFSKIRNPVLIRSWSYTTLSTAILINNRAYYQPNLNSFTYLPSSPQSPPSKYKNLDLFHLGGIGTSNKTAAILTFQRPATVYLFINVYNNLKKIAPATLPGWISEGWARLPSDQSKTIRFGIHQYSSFEVSPFSYVFSHPGNPLEVEVPHAQWVAKNVKGIKGASSIHLRIGERDGSPGKQAFYEEKVVKPGRRCPDIVHDSWGGSDITAGNKWFGSWHPQWDPCLWCAYDHEHGAGAPYLMGYKPKYGLTEYKNGRGIESDSGFKDFVFQYGGLMVYISIHAQTSSLRRVNQRHHTLTLVIKNAKSMELLMDISFKADYGFQSAKKKEGNIFVPLTYEGHMMKRLQMKRRPFKREFRSLNVINLKKLDPRFRYVRPKLLGNYEEWVTNIVCTEAAEGGELTLDIQDPITGIKDIDSMIPVRLGRKTVNGFMSNLALKRTLFTRDLKISAGLCGFGKDFKGGVFYTDPYFQELRSGNGKNNVKQFIKVGFETSLYGKWRPGGRWLGLHETGGKIYFADKGYGLDPKVN